MFQELLELVILFEHQHFVFQRLVVFDMVMWYTVNVRIHIGDQGK